MGNSFLTSIYFLIIFLILIPLVFADTTFFDNIDDFFILSNSTTTGEIIARTTGEITGTISGGACKYKWDCTNWSKCLLHGKQIRNCTNIGTCPDTYKTPEMEQNCLYIFEGEVIWREVIDKHKILIYFIIIFTMGFIIFYLKRDYFKNLIKNLNYKKI
jgi:hypothetical protein